MGTSCYLGEPLYSFKDFDEWCDKAASRSQMSISRGRHPVYVDSLGRICDIGKHFMIARDENAFPVTVYGARVDENKSHNVIAKDLSDA